MAVSNIPKYHIAMIPWVAMGHMTPLLHLANELAKRGHTITYFMPRKAQLKLQHLNLYPDLITFHTITIPHIDGLPPGTEIATEIPISLCPLLAEASDLAQDQIELAFRANKPNFVVHDNVYWMPHLAKQLGIKSICYNVVFAATLALVFVPGRNFPKDRPITAEDLSQPPPGYPSSKVVFRGHEIQPLMMITMPMGKNITFYERMPNTKSLCFSPDQCYLQKHINTPLEDQWDKWLGGLNPGSVVYCSFGSESILEKEQFQELVLGFELTGLPFLISLKTPRGCATIEEALPEGFEERVKGRGVVYGGWVQQPLILKHPSVGCFVSHGGPGSMWESLMSDCQIVLVPQIIDQVLNT
ncbi:Glycosyltransferase [Quillaja saponaria]|uniref:Glycosyltransferase n=1 Tax=Quillaja saponaria TaxID=32244 RepID=A0AAD7QHX5_QUISA|nr:Glycosyltransferase [Quillaja saponaria]